MSSKADNASAARDDGTNTSEVLVKLKDKVVLGREIPSQFSSPPWRVPVKSHAKADVINRILDRSMSVQSATIPGTDDFEDFIVSNSSMAVCGLLRTYLHAVLGKEVADQTKVTLGVFKWDPSARESEVDYEGSPYLWLQVLGRQTKNKKNVTSNQVPS